MSYQDQLIRIMHDADRILSPLREFERLYGRSFQGLADDLLERQRVVQSALPELSATDKSAIDSLQSALDRFRDLERRSPVVGFLSDANQAIARGLSSQTELAQIAQRTVVASRHWEQYIAAYRDLSPQLSAAELALKSHYSTVAEFSLLAQERLVRVPWDHIGRAVAMEANHFSELTSRFIHLADSYRSLVHSFEERADFLASFPPFVSELPPLEILTNARLIDYLSRTIEEILAEPDAGLLIEADLEKEIESTTEQLLTSLRPDLYRLLQGAKHALRSDNPDRGRHVVASLRELVTHLLHTVAPDDEVRAWTSNRAHFCNDRPTRKARLLFICREVNHGPFERFVTADVAAHLEFIALFQYGIHKLQVAFSDEQLRALIGRTEALVHFLLVSSGKVN